jgi:hypothetical protein
VEVQVRLDVECTCTAFIPVTESDRVHVPAHSSTLVSCGLHASVYHSSDKNSLKMLTPSIIIVPF